MKACALPTECLRTSHPEGAGAFSGSHDGAVCWMHGCMLARHTKAYLDDSVVSNEEGRPIDSQVEGGLMTGVDAYPDAGCNQRQPLAALHPQHPCHSTDHHRAVRAADQRSISARQQGKTLSTMRAFGAFSSSEMQVRSGVDLSALQKLQTPSAIILSSTCAF